MAKQLAESSKSFDIIDWIRSKSPKKLWKIAVTEIKNLLFVAKYFLVEERCRKCERFIHPPISHFERDKYSPPGEYWIADRQFRSDVLCVDCCNVISINDVIKSTVDIDDGNCYSMTIKVFSGTEFEGTIKKLIYRFKFDGDLGLLDDLRLLILKAWQSYAAEGALGTEPPVLVPVPLHWWRLQKRGFNQSELLAFGLAKLLKLKVMPYALTRHRRTKTQHELPKTRRQDNVRNAFKANKRFVSGKSVILIDDVCTSGATISACALALFEAGATSVTALTLAKVRLRE